MHTVSVTVTYIQLCTDVLWLNASYDWNLKCQFTFEAVVFWDVMQHSLVHINCTNISKNPGASFIYLPAWITLRPSKQDTSLISHSPSSHYIASSMHLHILCSSFLASVLRAMLVVRPQNNEKCSELATSKYNSREKEWQSYRQG